MLARNGSSVTGFALTVFPPTLTVMAPTPSTLTTRPSSKKAVVAWPGPEPCCASARMACTSVAMPYPHHTAESRVQKSSSVGMRQLEAPESRLPTKRPAVSNIGPPEEPPSDAPRSQSRMRQKFWKRTGGSKSALIFFEPPAGWCISVAEAGIVSSANFAGSCVLFGSYDQFLYCLSPKDGSVLWKVETDGYVHGTPAVAGDTVISAGCDGFLRVLRLKDGSEVRRVQLGGYVAGSPALADGKLVRMAVNQDMAQPSAAIEQGDEVAFFPPVTGG